MVPGEGIAELSSLVPEIAADGAQQCGSPAEHNRASIVSYRLSINFKGTSYAFVHWDYCRLRDHGRWRLRHRHDERQSGRSASDGELGCRGQEPWRPQRPRPGWLEEDRRLKPSLVGA